MVRCVTAGVNGNGDHLLEQWWKALQGAEEHDLAEMVGIVCDVVPDSLRRRSGVIEGLLNSIVGLLQVGAGP